MELVFAEGVLNEVLEAVEYFEGQSPGLGKSYLAHIEAGLDFIKRFPYASRVIRGEFRRLIIKRFPYGIIYRIDRDVLFIGAIGHLKRKPGYWADRIERP